MQFAFLFCLVESLKPGDIPGLIPLGKKNCPFLESGYFLSICVQPWKGSEMLGNLWASDSGHCWVSSTVQLLPHPASLTPLHRGRSLINIWMKRHLSICFRKTPCATDINEGFLEKRPFRLTVEGLTELGRKMREGGNSV